ncbi:MAG: hypothetical protein ACXAEN_22195 [Candidatus Thorarchaeota archaeon]|jgi:hypothetical protein
MYLTVIFAIDSLIILTVAIPYVIATVAIKDKRKRIYGCIVCFTLWLLASCVHLIQAFSFQYWVILSFTLETFVLLMTVLIFDLAAQVLSL